MLGISCPIEDLNINLVIFQFKNHFYIIIIQRQNLELTIVSWGFDLTILNTLQLNLKVKQYF